MNTWWNKIHSHGTLGQLVVLFIFTSFPCTKITTKGVSCLHCDFKGRFHIHFLIRSSGLLKVDNEFTFILIYLFEESSQLTTWKESTSEKKVGSLPNTFWQLLSLRCSSEPTAGLEGAREVTHSLGRPCWPWTVAGPCLPQAGVCQ